MDTKTKGDLAELLVAGDLMRQGFKVAFPFGDDWKFDLLASKDGIDFLRLQVKYVTPKNGVLTLRAVSTTIKANREITRNKYTAEQIDYLVALDSTTGVCYYIPSSELGGVTFNLRLIPAKNNQKDGVRWASDYANVVQSG